MINLDNLSLRQLQLECARALSVTSSTSNSINQFNKKAHHDSQLWYKTVIMWYISQYGDIPSKIGPGKDVKLIYDV